MSISPQQVLDYWFGGREVDGLEPYKRWFAGGRKVDRAIDGQFGSAVAEALKGGFDDWAETPASRLALIVMLDQFTRNLYRGTARAFAGDVRALALCHDGLAKQHDRELAGAQRGLFYLPLEHSESLADQDRSVELSRALAEETGESDRDRARKFLAFAEEHRETIARFGRFPHRNGLLGRASTPEEQRFLESAPRYGQ